MKAYY